VKPFSVLMAMNNAAAAWIGLDHGLTGPKPHVFDGVLVVVGGDRRRRPKRIARGERGRDDRAAGPRRRSTSAR
jgi:hypothetical protein